MFILRQMATAGASVVLSVVPSLPFTSEVTPQAVQKAPEVQVANTACKKQSTTRIFQKQQQTCKKHLKFRLQPSRVKKRAKFELIRSKSRRVKRLGSDLFGFRIRRLYQPQPHCLRVTRYQLCLPEAPIKPHADFARHVQRSINRGM